jgi:hypothetical protein
VNAAPQTYKHTQSDCPPWTAGAHRHSPLAGGAPYRPAKTRFTRLAPEPPAETARCYMTRTGMGQRLRYDGSPGPLLRRTPAHTTRRCRISWAKKCLLARAAQTRPSASTRALLPSLTADQAARLGSRTRITEAPLLAPVAVITALFPHLSLSLSQKQHTHSAL